jgi:hypothetical protein
MPVLNRSLVTSGIELEIIWLARVPDRVRAARVALRICRRVYNVRAGICQRIKIRGSRIPDDVAKGMVLFDHHHDVIKSRLLRLRAQDTKNYRAKDKRETKSSFHNQRTP